MAHVREEDLTDLQFEELCQHHAPDLMCHPRRPDRAAPVAQARTILRATYVTGFPEFSDGSRYDVAADDAYPDDGEGESDFDGDIGVDDAYPGGGIGAVPACGVAVAGLPRAVAGEAEAAREEECAVCMDGFREGEELRMPCPSEHRFQESCIFRWLTVSRVCPVCRFVLPPAKEESNEDGDTDSAAEETATGSDAETETDTESDTEVASDSIM
jgi:hypothetical protein